MSNRLNATLLMTALLGSLSWFPGFSADAGSGRMDLSSNATYEGECDFDDHQVKEQGKSCRARLRSDSKTEAKITARVVSVPKKRRLSDPAPVAGQETEEVLEVDIEASASVAGCTTGCSRNSTVTRRFPLADAKVLAAKALREFEQEAERLRGEAAREAAEQERRNKCEVGADGRELVGRAKRQCLLDRIAVLNQQDPEAAARFYDGNIKKMLMEMIKDNPHTRKDAEQMLQQLADVSGNNPYLKHALGTMNDFGQYYTVMSEAIAQYEMLPPDQRGPFAAKIAEAYRQGINHFRRQGLDVRSQLDAELASLGWEYSGTLAQDITNYEKQLTDIYRQHQQNIGGTSGLPTTNPQFQTRQPGAPGSGRGAFPSRMGNNGRVAPGRPSQPFVQGPSAGRPPVTTTRPGQPRNPSFQPRVPGGRVQ